MAFLFFAPGTAVLAAARVRLPVALALGPAGTVAIAGGGAVVANLAGLGWNRTAMVVATLVAVAVAVAVRLAFRPSAARVDARATAAGAIGTLVAAPVAAVAIVLGMVVPDRPVQTWDAIFHLNALRWIADTGTGSSLLLSGVSEPAPGYYPAGWHDVVALAVPALSPVVAANLSSLVIAALVWPAGLALLAERVVPGRRTAAFLAPVLGSSFAAFPARMLSYGTLWPNALSMALLPACLAALAMLLVHAGPRERVRDVAVLLAVLAGAVLAHPTAVFATAFLGAPLVVARGAPVLARRAERGRRGLAVALGAGVPVVALLALVALLRVPAIANTAAYPRPSIATGGQAVGEALFDSMLANEGFVTRSTAWLLGALAIAGAWLALRRRGSRWLVASWAISVGLYVVAAADLRPLRPLVGFWYSDPVRLGGLVVLTATLMATLAGAWLVRRAAVPVRRVVARLGRPAASRAGRMRGDAVPALAVVLVVLVALGSHGLRQPERTFELHRDYDEPLAADWGLLSPGELGLLARARRDLPAGSVTIGNPFDGSALLYAIADRRVVFPHVTAAWTPTELYLGKHFDRLDSDPRVCRALAALGVRYFYFDPHVYYHGNPVERTFSGLVPPPHGLTEIDRGGTAVLYRITGC